MSALEERAPRRRASSSSDLSSVSDSEENISAAATGAASADSAPSTPKRSSHAAGASSSAIADGLMFALDTSPVKSTPPTAARSARQSAAAPAHTPTRASAAGSSSAAATTTSPNHTVQYHPAVSIATYQHTQLPTVSVTPVRQQHGFSVVASPTSASSSAPASAPIQQRGFVTTPRSSAKPSAAFSVADSPRSPSKRPAGDLGRTAFALLSSTSKASQVSSAAPPPPPPPPTLAAEIPARSSTMRLSANAPAFVPGGSFGFTASSGSSSSAAAPAIISAPKPVFVSTAPQTSAALIPVAAASAAPSVNITPPPIATLAVAASGPNLSSSSSSSSSSSTSTGAHTALGSMRRRVSSGGNLASAAHAPVLSPSLPPAADHHHGHHHQNHPPPPLPHHSARGGVGGRSPALGAFRIGLVPPPLVASASPSDTAHSASMGGVFATSPYSPMFGPQAAHPSPHLHAQAPHQHPHSHSHSHGLPTSATASGGSCGSGSFRMAAPPGLHAASHPSPLARAASVSMGTSPAGAGFMLGPPATPTGQSKALGTAGDKVGTGPGSTSGSATQSSGRSRSHDLELDWGMGMCGHSPALRGLSSATISSASPASSAAAAHASAAAATASAFGTNASPSLSASQHPSHHATGSSSASRSHPYSPALAPLLAAGMSFTAAANAAQSALNPGHTPHSPFVGPASAPKDGLLVTAQQQQHHAHSSMHLRPPSPLTAAALPIPVGSLASASNALFSASRASPVIAPGAGGLSPSCCSSSASSSVLPAVATLNVEVMQSDSTPTMATAAAATATTYAHAVRRSTSRSRSVSTAAESAFALAASSSSAGSSDAGNGIPASASSASASVTDRANSDAHDGRPRLADFELLRVLGQGSYGKVMLARHARTQQLFAMKILRKDTVLKREQVANTRSERDVLTSVRHPFIVHLHCAFQTKDKLYLLLDFVPGGELFNRLNITQRLPEEVARFYAAEIVLVFEHLHNANILYRDLKPENILLQPDGHLCLTDFGLAKQLGDDAAGSNSFCGTVDYMAPEIVARTAEYGKAADWWALGVLIHEMLTGNTPFKGPNRKKVQENIISKPLKLPGNMSFDAQQIVKKLLQRSPHKRLGFGGAHQVMKSDFFASVDWAALACRQVPAPFIPQLADAADVSNFDSSFTKLHAVDSPVDYQLSPATQQRFAGFSFTRSPMLGPAPPP